eukprot:CAMPEP_0167806422 /NCGR_PEP_ID=MMETSP0111_2-20121227/21833_1 /TAXON_ID=91324 /ORGANISM="Lotharella globosa, Strain CCCM811" /LENGTH=98 /DNA_ID=CAMNT_0007703901 /DNA_START=800 /DNA_END=1096 /DNA_ORIENTATION=-
MQHVFGHRHEGLLHHRLLDVAGKVGDENLTQLRVVVQPNSILATRSDGVVYIKVRAEVVLHARLQTRYTVTFRSHPEVDGFLDAKFTAGVVNDMFEFP